MELVFPEVIKDKYASTSELAELLQLYFKHVQTLLESGRCDVEYLKAHIDEIAAQVEKEWRRKRVQNVS